VMTGRLLESYRAEVERMRQDQLRTAAEKVWSQVS
jgi:hypothetical protein